MAMPTKKTRKIVVDSEEYHWGYSEKWKNRHVRKDSDCVLVISLMIETVGQQKSRLIDRTEFPASMMLGELMLIECWEPGVILQPRHVAALIRLARESGWNGSGSVKEQHFDFLRDILLNDPHDGAFLTYNPRPWI